MLNFLLFVVCYLAGFLLAIFSNPVWAFVLYQIVYFMHPLDRWWSYLVPQLSYSFYTVLLMLVLFLKDFRQHNKNRLLDAPQFKWMYCIGIAYIFACFYAALPESNNNATINFIKLLIIMSVAYKLVDSDSKLNMILKAYIGGAAYIGFMVYQVGRNAGDRVAGVGTVDGPDTNDAAAAIAPALVILIYYLWANKSIKSRALFAVAGAFIANALVLINSRGAFLATIVGTMYLFTYMLFSSYQVKYQRASVIGLMLAGLIGAAFIVDHSAIERFLGMKSEGLTKEEETGATRVFFWMAAIDMAKDHPFGAGAQGFEVYSPEYLPHDIDTGATRNRAVHSAWFQALTEIGYPGLFFAVMLIFSSFRATNACKRELLKQNHIDRYFKVIAIEAALISFMVAMTFLNRLRAEVLYWCILFTACAYNIYVVKKNQ